MSKRCLNIQDKVKKTKNDEFFGQYKILRNKLLIRYGKLNKIILVVKYATIQILKGCGEPELHY